MGKIGDGALATARIGEMTTSHIDRLTDDGLVFVDGQSVPAWVVTFDVATRTRVVSPYRDVRVGL